MGAALFLGGSLAWFLPQSLAQLPAFEGEDCGWMTEDFKAILNPQFFSLDPSVETRTSQAPRLRLFRITPGFLADPLGMTEDEGVLRMPNLPKTDLTPKAPESGPEWLQVGMGADVPFFDLRRPGDPGGFGYYRVNTQVSLFDSPTTACALGVQAVTPTGAQFGGLPDGPTVVIPAFSVFHALNDRFALQGFVSKNMPVSDAATTPLQRHVQYGLALQRPLLAEGPEGLRNLYFSVGALGQLIPQHDALRLAPHCDVLPGLQWHVNDNWWLSSAVLMPFGPVRTAPGQWQLTCSLQF
jgi:hypothetical protein